MTPNTVKPPRAGDIVEVQDKHGTVTLALLRTTPNPAAWMRMPYESAAKAWERQPVVNFTLVDTDLNYCLPLSDLEAIRPCA